MGVNEEKVKGKPTTDVAKRSRGRAVGGGGLPKKRSATAQVSLFERVPQSERLAWPDIAAILSGVVSSLSKLMGGGIVAFYAGCQMGGVTVAITFALSFVLTWLVGRICFREGLPNNVVSRYYIFGKKGSAAGSLIWIFVLVGVLAVGTVQLGNAILFAFGWEGEWARWALFIGISCVWVLMALFGTKIIARMNAVFVVALFCVMGYVVYLIAAEGQLVDAATHGILIPGVQPLEGFAYSVNYAIMTSGLFGPVRGRLHPLRPQGARSGAHLAYGQPLRYRHLYLRCAHRLLRLRQVRGVLQRPGYEPDAGRQCGGD